MTGNDREPSEEMEDLMLTMQIVLNNHESLEEALEEGDEVERMRTVGNYLASINTLTRHSYRIAEEIDREVAERCRDQLDDWFDSK